MKKLALIFLTVLMVISTPQFVMAAGFEPSSLPPAGTASRLTSSFSVDGKEYKLPAYEIYSNYFFKLRDVAAILSGTEKEFAVGWDGAKQEVHINTGQSYKSIGSEMKPVAGEKPFIRSGAEFFINGEETPLTSYIIDAVHYIKIYDISKKLDFLVEWDESADVLAITASKQHIALEGASIPINYSDAASWYKLPDKAEKSVDCFYVLPTCWKKQNPNEPNFTQIDNPSLIGGADIAYNNGGIAYSEACNMYVPYYRQLDASVRVDMAIVQQDAMMADLPVKDVISAFDYYIKNYNNGRPFIIAGHSQGSDVCRYILSEYMKDNPDVYKRMVAAYPIGYAVTSDFLNANPHLKFAESADDTGVIISYNTEAAGYNLPSLVVRKNNLAINPISWSRDETPAVSEHNSRMNIDGEYVEITGMANATVNKERGVVNISGVDLDKYAPGSEVFPRGSLHGLDYPLYFNDIRENIKNRIEKYFEGMETAEFVYTPVDYSIKSNWALMPDKSDKPVDVFYAYPTAWSKPEGSSSKYAEINDTAMVERVKMLIGAQATAFEEAGNLYVPYYRPCDAQEALTMSVEGKEKLLLDGPTKDLTAAFDYYIKNINNNRPFILAGHSQGSNLLIYLLSDYMRENPDVQERMVAAYVIGYSVTDSYLAKNPHLKFAEGRNDTGVIISYNTEAPGITKPNPVIEPGARVINPVSWTTDEEYAKKELSLGSRIDDGTGKYVKTPNYADAQINNKRGTLICSSIDPEKQEWNELFGKGNYHGLDYQLYYYDLAQNSADRIKAFLQSE